MSLNRREATYILEEFLVERQTERWGVVFQFCRAWKVAVNRQVKEKKKRKDKIIFLSLPLPLSLDFLGKHGCDVGLQEKNESGALKFTQV